MGPTMINRPCVLVLRDKTGEEDDFSNEAPDETEVESFCEIQQVDRSEPGDQGELSDTLWNGYFPAGTDLSTADAVRVPDLGEFELVGAPWPVRNRRTQQESHVEASLRRTGDLEAEEDEGS